MDETTQQLIALSLVAVVIGAELWRRWKKRQSKSDGCDGCDSPGSTKKDAGEAPVRFYRRR
ncbi:MAG: hypothetical protein HKN56_11140 [Gammaproteobacteria bacterium]|nr:hypothetical protein [Gammaproteobacteria bacterium]